MKKIVVNVTAKDIRDGIREDCIDCPIALAATRRFKYPCIATDFAIWPADEDDDDGRCPLPPEAIEFIKDFDMGKPVKPFKFTVSV